jgi:hypothetical protein
VRRLVEEGMCRIRGGHHPFENLVGVVPIESIMGKTTHLGERFPFPEVAHTGWCEVMAAWIESRRIGEMRTHSPLPRHLFSGGPIRGPFPRVEGSGPQRLRVRLWVPVHISNRRIVIQISRNEQVQFVGEGICCENAENRECSTWNVREEIRGRKMKTRIMLNEL